MQAVGIDTGLGITGEFNVIHNAFDQQETHTAFSFLFDDLFQARLLISFEVKASSFIPDLENYFFFFFDHNLKFQAVFWVALVRMYH